MKNMTYNSILSADGKSFSLTAIMDTVTKQAQRYARKWGHSMREEDVEDLIGEVLYRVSKYFSTRFDSTKAPVEAWLGRIVFREGSDMLRRIISKEKFCQEEAEVLGKSSPYADDMEDTVDARCKCKELQCYLGTLDERKQACMRMYGEGYKSGEIAEELGMTPEEVYRTVCREKKRLANEPWLR